MFIKNYDCPWFGFQFQYHIIENCTDKNKKKRRK